MTLAFGSLVPANSRPMTDQAHLTLRIETERPIELAEFVGTFVGIGNLFERFEEGERPDDESSTRFYVREVRAGSILGDLVPYAAGAGGSLGLAAAGIKYANDIAKFVETYGKLMKRFFKRGGRQPEASKSDLTDYLKTVQAIAHDPAANMTMTAFDDGETRAVFAFGTSEAREAETNILEQRAEMDATTAADHSRVLMRFVRPSAETGKPGRKGGERAIIDRISPSARAVLYASDLAEQRMRHELKTAEGNVFKLLFDVDVNVEVGATGKPLAYRVTAMHAVLEADEEGGLL